MSAAASFSVLRNVSLMTAERVVGLVLGFAVGIAVMRYLGPENNARLVGILAVVSLLATFAKLGLDQVVMREAAAPGIDSRRIILRFAGVRLLAALVTGGALLILHDWIAPHQAPAAIALGTALVLIQATDLGVVWCRSLGLFTFASATVMAVQIASSLLKILFMTLHVGYEWFLAGALAEAMLLAGVLNWRAASRVASTKPAASPEARTISVSEVAFMTATTAVVVTYFAFDALVLPRLMPLAEAGRFLAARSLVDTATLVGVGLTTALLPVLTGLARSDSGRFARVLAAGMNAATYLGLATGIALLTAYLLAVGPVLGEKYSGLAPIVLILSLGLPIFFQGGMVDAHLTITKRTSTIMAKAALALLIKALLVFGGARWLTLEFVAIASLISAYAASLLVTFGRTKDVFWGQLRSLDPRLLAESWRTITQLK